MQLLTVSETTLTRAGLMRPNICYQLDGNDPIHVEVLKGLLAKGGVGIALDAAAAADVMAAGLAHYADDSPAPVFEPVVEPMVEPNANTKAAKK